MSHTQEIHLASTHDGACAIHDGVAAVAFSGPNRLKIYGRDSGGTWSLLDSLVPSGGIQQVAFDRKAGDRVVALGSTFVDIFAKDSTGTFFLEQTITIANPSAGRGLALYDTTLMVLRVGIGAKTYKLLSTGVWALTEVLVPTNLLDGNPFSLSFYHQTAVIGNPFDFAGGDRGSADIFREKLGEELLKASGGGGTFTVGETVLGLTSGATGQFVAESGGYLRLDTLTGVFQSGETVAGGTSFSTRTTEAEPVSTYYLLQTETAADGIDEDSFGFDVGVHSSRLAISAPTKFDTTGPGHVYIYKLLADPLWTLEQEKEASDFADDDGFGYRISMSCHRLIVGSIGANSFEGAAYVLDLSGGVWSETEIVSVGGANQMPRATVDFSLGHFIMADLSDDCYIYTDTAYSESCPVGDGGGEPAGTQVDTAGQAAASVLETNLDVASAQAAAFVAGRCSPLRPNADVSHQGWSSTSTPAGSTFWDQLNEAVFQPATPSGTKYIRGQRTSATPPFLQCKLRVGFEDLVLPSFEEVNHVQIWLYVYFVNFSGNSFVDIQYRLYKPGDTNPIIASGTGGSGLMGPIGSWVHADYYGTLSQAEVEGLEAEVNAIVGGAQVQIRACYVEVCTGPKPLDTSAQAAASVKDSSSVAGQAAASVRETMSISGDAKALVAEVHDISGQAAASVLGGKIAALAAASVRDTTDVSGQATAMVVVKEIQVIEAAASAFVSRFPTARHFCATESVRLLVEVDWPAAQRRYAGHDVAVEETGYDGRLIDIGEVVQGTGSRRDAVEITLENLEQCATVESLWSDASPPEGSQVRVYYWFEGDKLSDRVEVFRGVVEHVEEVTETVAKISAISIQEIYDVPLGQEVNTSDFPDAPEESVGKFQPIVMGTIRDVEGIPTTTIAKSNLTGSHLATDTVLDLEDASRFPASGTVVVLDEQVTYSGKSGNSLTGCTRGAGGTTAADYGGGTEVVERGSLEVIFSGHEVAAIDAVYAFKGSRRKLLDPSEYTPSLSPRGRVTFADGWPRVPVPSGAGQFAQIQFDAAGGGNTASNPGFACAEFASWTDKNYAQIAAAQKLVVDQTTPQAAIGEILRAYIMVEYDPSTLGAGDFTVKEGANNLGNIRTVGGLLGNLPSTLKNQGVALGSTRAYNDDHFLSDPSHFHPAGGPQTVTQFLDFAEAFGANINAAIDKQFGPGHFDGQAGTAQPKFALRSFPSWVPEGSFTVRLRVDGNSTIGAVSVSLFKNGFGSAQASVTLGTTRASPTSGPVTFTSIAQLIAAGSYAICGSPNVQIYEVWYEITYNPPSTGAAVTSLDQTSNTPLRYTVGYLADVTALAAGDWGWFVNRSIAVEHSGVAATLRVVRVCFVVEFSPYRLEPADKVLADLRGLVPDGDPSDILAEVVTNPYLMDLAPSAYNAGDFARAQGRLNAEGYRLDFCVRSRPHAGELLSKIADQSQLLHWWEEGMLSVAFRERIADIAEPYMSFQKDDIVKCPVRSRGVLRDVVTQLVVRFGWSDRYGKMTKTAKSEVLGAFATRTQELDYDLVQDATTAQGVADFSTERLATPRFTVEVPVYLPGLEVRRGDPIEVVTDRFTYRKTEVQQIKLNKEVVTIQALVLDTI